MTNTYIAAEPDQITGYMDSLGKIHASREDAIDATFKHDFRDAVSRLCVSPGRFAEMPFLNSVALIEHFISEYPDMVRVLLGDRDAT